MSGDDFLSRWSRRKTAARQAEATPTVPSAPEPAAESAPKPPDAPPPQSEETGSSPAPRALPAVESLDPESDFAPFMRGKVDPDTRRAALKVMFQDPHFNVVDMLDVYMDDYSIPDPIPAEWMGRLNQLASLGDHGLEPGGEPAPESPDPAPGPELVEPGSAPPKIEQNQADSGQRSSDTLDEGSSSSTSGQS